MATLTSLRASVRMYRRGVVGADTALLDLLMHDADCIASLLEVPLDALERAVSEVGSAEAIAQLLDARDRRRRSKATGSALASAQTIAEALGESARSDGERVHLDPDVLAALLHTGANGELVILREGPSPGAVDLRYLRKVFKTLRSCAVSSVYVAGGWLVVVYAAEGSRGRLRLALAPPDPRKTSVTLHLGERRPPETPPVRARPLRGFLDALSAEIGW